jgi:hypothetical protein
LNYKSYLVKNYIIYFYWIILVFTCLFWKFEEPNKVTTILNLTFIYFLGVYFIFKYWDKKKIINIQLWTFIYFLKIFFSIIFLYFFIATPLIPIDKLRTSFQDPLLTDSNFYDFIALEIKKNGLFDNFSLFFSTWLSFGIILYTYLIYLFMGTSILYVTFCNCFLILISSLFFSSSVKNFINDFKDYKFGFISLFMILPYCTYYDLTPSKETLSVFVLSYFFYQLSKYIYSKANPSILNLFLSISLIFFVRPNLGVLVIPILFFYLQKKISIFKLAFSIFFLFAFIIIYFQYTIGLDTILNSYTDFSRLAENQQNNADLVSNGDGVKNYIFLLFSPTGLFSTIFLFPFRLIIWLLLPFPYIFFDFSQIFALPYTLNSNWNLYYRIPEALSRLLSTHLIISSMPFIWFTIKKQNFDRNNINNLKNFTWLFFLVLTIALSTFNFANGGRYRIVVEPFYFLLVIIGIHLSRIKLANLFRYYIFYFMLIFFASILYTFVIWSYRI